MERSSFIIPIVTIVEKGFMMLMSSKLILEMLLMKNASSANSTMKSKPNTSIMRITFISKNILSNHTMSAKWAIALVLNSRMFLFLKMP